MNQFCDMQKLSSGEPIRDGGFKGNGAGDKEKTVTHVTEGDVSKREGKET